MSDASMNWLIEQDKRRKIARRKARMGNGVTMKSSFSDRHQMALPLVWPEGFSSNGNTADEKRRALAALVPNPLHIAGTIAIREESVGDKVKTVSAPHVPTVQNVKVKNYA